MSFTVRSIGARAIAAAAFSALVGCGQVASPDSPGCHKDNECPSGSACSVGACVPRITGTTQPWLLELAPKTESMFALTEKPGVTFGAAPAQLRVEGKVKIDGQITDVDPMLAAPTMRVLLSLPSAIGKGERQFESEATRATDDKSRLRFALFVPESAVGQSAKITVFPVTPVDQVLPVWTVALATLGPTVILGVPKSNEFAMVVGVLQDEMELAQPGYVARAMMGDRLVSNVFKTDMQGRFNLKIPTAEANAVDLNMVRVELVPADANMVKPRLEAKLTATKLNLGVLRLPPRSNPQALDIPVTVQGPSLRKLPGVSLRFSAQLLNAFGGIASLEREFQTDKEGVAHVTLLPGPAGQTLDYTVTVVPPPNSEFAARCFRGYSVAAVPSGQARVGASIELGNKLEMTGQVTDAAAAPQAGVILTALRQAPTGPQDCDSQVLTAPTTVTTGSDGRYKLLLDPGRYRLEYEPPMGSNASMFVENDVIIDKGLERGVMLPGGVLATGVVTSYNGDGVLGCEVRVFGQPKDGEVPALRARARTAADGHFSIVLPKDP